MKDEVTNEENLDRRNEEKKQSKKTKKITGHRQG